MKKEIVAKKGVAAIGPYSPGIVLGDLIFCSGHIGVDPKTKEFVKGAIEEQTRQALTNLEYVLEEAGGSLQTILKTTVYLKSMDDYGKMNEVYASFFQKPYPARATVQVAKLPKDALVEIDAVAYITRPMAHEEGGCGCGGNCGCS
ncbi:RidA family protein [Candidatus Gottesmanbacteria bacterium]|nr:RidA family protein [Candidatus Gottesmanbacteria bacterium]